MDTRGYWKPNPLELGSEPLAHEPGSQGQPRLEEFNAELIFEPDDRLPVTDTTQFPARAIAQIIVHYNIGPDEFATGWFLSRNVVITAAHAISQAGRTALTARVIPGRNGATSAPFRFADSQTFAPSQNWNGGSNPQADYAAIRLPVPLGDVVGFFGVRVFTDQQLASVPFDVVGYPFDDKPIGTMWSARGPVVPSPFTLSYVMDTTGGQSGAPVFGMFGSQFMVAGIHGGGDPMANRAVRITETVFQELLAWKNS
jgi:glutamyl endopeptidase